MTSCGCDDYCSCFRVSKRGKKTSGRFCSFFDRVFCLRKKFRQSCLKDASSDIRSSSSGIPSDLVICGADCQDVNIMNVSISSSEQALICFSVQHKISLTNRFLTLRKRRKKHLISRSLNKYKSLLDDILLGQCQLLLNRIEHWDFSAFTLDYVAGGHSLPVLCVHLFYKYGLLCHFGIDPVKAWNFFSLVEQGYRSNPYHNSIHATDVTQAMNCFIQEDKIFHNLQPLEKAASLIASVAHDLDHPGVTQSFLISTHDHLAYLYKNASVLENHHWRSCVSCLHESGMLNMLDVIQWRKIIDQVKNLILATDMARHEEYLNELRSYTKTGGPDPSEENPRHFVLCVALKCADISNLCRPSPVSQLWSKRVCDEFYRQGDYEKKLGISVTPICDKQLSPMPAIQIKFLLNIVRPLFELWHAWMLSPLSSSLMDNLRSNEQYWHHQSSDTTEAANNDDDSNMHSSSHRRYSVPINSTLRTRCYDKCYRRHSEFLLPDSDPFCEPETTAAAVSLMPELNIASFRDVLSSNRICHSAKAVFPDPPTLTFAGCGDMFSDKLYESHYKAEQVNNNNCQNKHCIKSLDSNFDNHLLKKESFSSKNTHVLKPLQFHREYSPLAVICHAANDNVKDRRCSEPFCITGFRRIINTTQFPGAWNLSTKRRSSLPTSLKQYTNSFLKLFQSVIIGNSKERLSLVEDREKKNRRLYGDWLGKNSQKEYGSEEIDFFSYAC